MHQKYNNAMDELHWQQHGRLTEALAHGKGDAINNYIEEDSCEEDMPQMCESSRSDTEQSETNSIGQSMESEDSDEDSVMPMLWARVEKRRQREEESGRRDEQIQEEQCAGRGAAQPWKKRCTIAEAGYRTSHLEEVPTTRTKHKTAKVSRDELNPYAEEFMPMNDKQGIDDKDADYDENLIGEHCSDP